MGLPGGLGAGGGPSVRLGLNWWATRRWKASVGYGNIDLDKGGLTGNTDTWLGRVQWIY